MDPYFINEFLNLLLLIAIPLLVKGLMIVKGEGIIVPVSKTKVIVVLIILHGFFYITLEFGLSALPWFLVSFIILTVLMSSFRIGKFSIEAYQMDYHQAEHAVISWLEDERLPYKKTIRGEDGLTLYEVEDDIPFHAVLEERKLFTSKTDKRTIIDIERDGFTHKLEPRVEELSERLQDINPATAPVKRALFHIIPGALLLLPGVTAFILG